MNDYQRVARVIRYLTEHQIEQPQLEELADHAGVSRFQLHRLFGRWAGVTPKDFLKCLTHRHARDALRSGRSVLDAAFDAGLSGPGRLHDLCVTLEAASPGEIKAGGRGWTIRAGFAESPFGTCAIGESPRGICHLSFVDAPDERAIAAVLAKDWPHAEIAWTNDAQSIARDIFTNTAGTGQSPLRAFVRGTKFQVRVWQALLQIPSGSRTSYGELANALGNRSAARAVGAAVGQNRLGYLIPCHRVIHETGIVGHYRWGTTRKQAMLAWEAGTGPEEETKEAKGTVESG